MFSVSHVSKNRNNKCRFAVEQKTEMMLQFTAKEVH